MNELDNLLKEISRLTKELDKARSYAEGCAIQAGNLASGAADALDMKYTVVVPDDKDIIAQAALTNARLREAQKLLGLASEALGNACHSSTISGRLISIEQEKLADRINIFLGELNEAGN